MANTKFLSRFQNKRDTAANFTTNNPVLLDGELVVVDTGSGVTRLKSGDGSSKFSALPYLDEPIYNKIPVASTIAGKAPGTAAVGSSTKYAREDHVHPKQTTVSGNAGTATKLATARTINGVSFDGSANITVADSTKLPLTGGTLTGILKFKTSSWAGNILASNAENKKRYELYSNSNSGAIAPVVLSVFTDDTGSANVKYIFGTNGTLSATTFSGSLSGNATTATTATKLGTADVGTATKPIYLDAGVPKACTYTLGKSVPSNAVFTDTNTWRPLGTGADDACAGNDSRLSNARPASDVSAWAKAASKPTYTASEVGAIPTSAKGAASGVASLDSSGKVPSAQLPSYVDDVLEYAAKSNFPSTGESGKIYIDSSNNKTYRWSGSAYVEISASLALGTTSSTAFAGDKGNTAYAHATAKGSAFASGLYKITTNAQGHVTAATKVTKSDITGLGIPSSDTNTWIAFKGATTDAAGTAGYAPAPAAGSANRYLRSDGTWAVPPNTNTDTKVSITTTNPSTGTSYYIPFSSSSSSSATGLCANNGIKYWTLEGTTGAIGISELILGNSAKTGTAGNKQGQITIYGTGTGYTVVKPGNNTDTNITITLPSSSGTIALTSSSITGSAAKWTVARTLSFTGDASGSMSVDGSANKSATLTLANSGVIAGTYGPTANATATHGGTFNVPEVIVDAKGRITSAYTRTITLPSLPSATTSAKGIVQLTTSTSSTSTTLVPTASALNQVRVKAEAALPKSGGTISGFLNIEGAGLDGSIQAFSVYTTDDSYAVNIAPKSINLFDGSGSSNHQIFLSLGEDTNQTGCAILNLVGEGEQADTRVVIRGLYEPTEDSEAANKAYVDSMCSSIIVKSVTPPV